MEYSSTEYVITYRCGHQAVIDLAETTEYDHELAAKMEGSYRRCRDCERMKECYNQSSAPSDLPLAYEFEDRFELSRLDGSPVDRIEGAMIRAALLETSQYHEIRDNNMDYQEWEMQYLLAFTMVRDAKFWAQIEMGHYYDHPEDIHELINLDAPLHKIQFTSRPLIGPTMFVPESKKIIL